MNKHNKTNINNCCILVFAKIEKIFHIELWGISVTFCCCQCNLWLH